MSMAPAVSQAANIQLGFVLDESGSIAASEWNIIRNGLASAINLIPTTGPNTYFLSVVTFDSDANLRINNVQVTAANQASLSTQIAGFAQGGGSTNYQAAFAGMDAALGTSTNYDYSYVNFATDGEPNTCTSGSNAWTCGIAARDALIASGVDNISIEGIGIGAGAAANLQTSICYPGPCDTTSPYNFPTQGFYIGVANATEYAAAIGGKVRTVTGQVPEPATLALVGLSLAGLGAMRRRKQAAAA
ncbi:MAG: VWA domain-containing protein [Betaproteobacteria bacterium]|nr:VWA domain-containing protein [Betaproteobacteria bacterium]